MPPLLATLPANPHSRTVSIAGDGNVTKSPQLSNYAHNASVTLTATTNAGYTFAGWSGDTNSSLNPLSVVMTTNETVTANARNTTEPASPDRWC